MAQLTIIEQIGEGVQRKGHTVGQLRRYINESNVSISLASSSLLSLQTSPTILAPGDSIEFFWNGTQYVEVDRDVESARGAIYAVDYGLATGNTGTANATALALAIAAAQAANKEVHIAAGTYLINQHSLSVASGYSVAASVLIGASTVIRGAGIGLTVLKCDGYIEAAYTGPTGGVGYTKTVAHDDGTAMFTTKYNVSGISLTLSDMTLEGPPEGTAGGGQLGLSMDQNNAWGIYCAGGGSLTLERVAFTKWSQDVKLSNNYPSYPGAGTVCKISDCSFRWRSVGILTQDTTTSGGSLDILRSRFEYNSDMAALLYSTEGGQSNGACHALYINNGTSLRTIGNTFVSTGGPQACAWRHSSVGGSDVPKYSESIGDYFASGCNAAMIANPDFESSIIGATIHVASGNSAIQMAGPCKISGCRFIGATGAQYGVTDGSFTSGQAFISDTVFEGDFLYAVARLNNTAGRWRIGPNVEVNTTSSDGGAGIRVLGGGIDIDGVLFHVTTAASASVIVAGGDVGVSASRFTSGTKPIVISPTSAAVTIDFGPGNVFEDSTRQLITPDGSHNISVLGQMGTFGAGAGIGWQMVGSAGATLSGQLQCGRGIGTYTYSSGTLTIDDRFDTYSINEGAGPTINSINMLCAVSGGATQAQINGMYTARVYLHVKQTFTLGNAGNIVAAGGARTANTVVTLQYFPAEGKWIEI